MKPKKLLTAEQLLRICAQDRLLAAIVKDREEEIRRRFPWSRRGFVISPKAEEKNDTERDAADEEGDPS